MPPSLFFIESVTHTVAQHFAKYTLTASGHFGKVNLIPICPNKFLFVWPRKLPIHIIGQYFLCPFVCTDMCAEVPNASSVYVSRRWAEISVYIKYDKQDLPTPKTIGSMHGIY